MELEAAIERVKSSLTNCPPGFSEAKTRQTLIDPVLSALGWNMFDSFEVDKEHALSDGTRADYILKAGNREFLVVEAKAIGVSLTTKERVQCVNYAQHIAAPMAALTNGDHWEISIAAESSLKTDERVAESFFISKIPAADAAAKLSLLSKESAGNLDALVDVRPKLWLPKVKDSLKNITENDFDSLYDLFIKQNKDFAKPGMKEVAEKCCKELLNLAFQAPLASFHLERPVKRFQQQNSYVESDTSRKHKGADKFLERTGRLPDSLCALFNNIRNMFLKAGFEERVYDVFMSFNKNGRTIYIDYYVRDAKICINPPRKLYPDFQSFPQDIRTYLEERTSNFFNAAYKIVIRPGDEQVATSFIREYIAQIG